MYFEVRFTAKWSLKNFGDRFSEAVKRWNLEVFTTPFLLVSPTLRR